MCQPYFLLYTQPASLLLGCYKESCSNLEACQMMHTAKMNHSRHMTYGLFTLTILRNMTHQAIFPTLREELCLSSSCNASAMEFVLVALNDMIQPRELYVDTESSSYISYGMDPLPMTTGAIVMICVTAIMVLLVIIGSLVTGIGWNCAIMYVQCVSLEMMKLGR